MEELLMYSTVTDEENLQNRRVNQLVKVQKEGLELFKKKNKDYGDAFATYGPIGVLVRIGDKIQRLLSISKSGITLVNDESMYDTLLDFHNYSAMAMMLFKDDKKQALSKLNFTNEIKPQLPDHPNWSKFKLEPPELEPNWSEFKLETQEIEHTFEI